MNTAVKVMPVMRRAPDCARGAVPVRRLWVRGVGGGVGGVGEVGGGRRGVVSWVDSEGEGVDIVGWVKRMGGVVGDDGNCSSGGGEIHILEGARDDVVGNIPNPGWEPRSSHIGS